MASDMDFNGADTQDAAFDLIPANTLVKVCLTVRPGGAGPEGWLTQSKTSPALYLNTEAVVMEGPFARRRIYTRIGFRGKAAGGPGDDTYGNRGRAMIRGILESARGVRAHDQSSAARAARMIRSLGELSGLEFVARIGIERDKDKPEDSGRNVIKAAIGADHAEYASLMGSVPQPPQQGQFTARARSLWTTAWVSRARRPPAPRPSGHVEGTAMIPRDYQRAAVDAARDRTAAHGNTMLVLPTGAGKTAIAGFYIGEELEQRKHDRVLVLQHTDELIDQNRSAIGTVTGMPTSVVKAEQDDWGGRIVFGSVRPWRAPTGASGWRRSRISSSTNATARPRKAIWLSLTRPGRSIRRSSCSGSRPRRVAAMAAAYAAPSAMSAITSRSAR